MSKENILTVQSALRGFHVYKAIWQPEEGEKLMCEHEENNKYDLFAIKVCPPLDRKIVGHLPIEISRITRFIIAHGAIVEAQLTAVQYRRSSLVQGGLEIPCSLTSKMPATKKRSELLKKHLELFEWQYTEPQEIIILGTFNKKDSLATTSREATGKRSAGIKHESNKPKSTDIRRWFKPAGNKVNDPSAKKKRSEESSIIVID